MALAYTLVGVLLGLTTIVVVGIAVGLWFAMSAARPELLEKRPRDRG